MGRPRSFKRRRAGVSDKHRDVMPPLRRNRDFVLLQGGQLLSSAGSQTTTIAYPLVVLATTHSAAAAGLVGFGRLVPSALLTLPAGVAADRVDRRGLMIGSDVLRGIALGALAAALIAGTPPLWAILVVAVVEGVGISVFGVAENGALRAVVPPEQLADATGVLIGRRSVVFLLGPPLGGLLFGLGHAVPFAVDAATYAASTLSLLAMRTPFQETRAHDRARLRAQLAEGLRFLWRQPFLRTTSAIYGIGNFMVPAVVLTLVVSARDQGLSGGRTGVLVAAIGAATLVGSLVSPLVRRRLPARAILLLELWSWLGLWVYVAHPDAYVLAAMLVPFGVCASITDSVVLTLRVALTPDRLLGRVTSAATTLALAIAPLGPLAAGALISAASARATVAAIAAMGLGLAVWGTLSPAVRTAPALAGLGRAVTERRD
jgi:MFS family permease